jgi:putative two-component system response regulator
METQVSDTPGPVLVQTEPRTPDEPRIPDWTGGVAGVSTATNWEHALDDVANPPTILIVDGLELNRRLLKGILKASNYRIIEATRPSEAFAILESEKIDLVMPDLVMPEMSGIEFCAMLKAERSTQLLPILMTTGVQGIENEVAGLESGADEFLIRPIKPSLVRVRVRTLLRNKALIDSLEEAESILFALAQAVEQRDRYTGLHCERLAAYGMALARAIGLPKTDLQSLFRGGYLHDIGKISIPDNILFKRGLLTDQEWVTMRQHTVRGEEICRTMKSLAPVLPIIRSHHERWDGTGYPDGLRGEEIPLLARVIQVADIYDALTTARPYKPAFTHERAISIMLEEAQRGWRDPELVPLFAEISRPVDGLNAVEWQEDDGMQQSLENMRRSLSR